MAFGLALFRSLPFWLALVMTGDALYEAYPTIDSTFWTLVATSVSLAGVFVASIRFEFSFDTMLLWTVALTFCALTVGHWLPGGLSSQPPRLTGVDASMLAYGLLMLGIFAPAVYAYRWLPRWFFVIALFFSTYAAIPLILGYLDHMPVQWVMSSDGFWSSVGDWAHPMTLFVWLYMPVSLLLLCAVTMGQLLSSGQQPTRAQLYRDAPEKKEAAVENASS